jgi:two-component system response regulator MtrA
MSALSILAVEDDPIVRADLRLILEDHGFAVADARDGAEAIELARSQRPDLILIDLNLPEVDGIEATRQILSERDVPVVALTGATDAAVIERAVEAGAVDHVTKPFSERRLVEAVRTALGPRLEDAVEIDHYAMRVLIEQMVREGHGEREIEAAVRRATGAAEPRRSLVARLFGR